jgi:hypothetical protein
LADFLTPATVFEHGEQNTEYRVNW